MSDPGNGNVIRHRLEQLEHSVAQLGREQKEMRSEMHAEFNKIQPRLSVLEWKSGMWGAIAGAVMILGAILMQSL